MSDAGAASGAGSSAYHCSKCMKTVPLLSDLRKHLHNEHPAQSDRSWSPVTVHLNSEAKKLEKQLNKAKVIEQANKEKRRYQIRPRVSSYASPKTSSATSKPTRNVVHIHRNRESPTEKYNKAKKALYSHLQNPVIPVPRTPLQDNVRVVPKELTYDTSNEVMGSSKDNLIRGKSRSVSPPSLSKNEEDQVLIEVLETKLQIKSRKLDESEAELRKIAKENISLQKEALELSNISRSSQDELSVLKDSIELAHKESLDKEKEIEKISSFLEDTAEKESESRQKLESFMESLLNRTEKAENKVEDLKNENRLFHSASMRSPRFVEQSPVVQRSASAIGQQPMHTSTPNEVHSQRYRNNDLSHSTAMVHGDNNMHNNLLLKRSDQDPHIRPIVVDVKKCPLNSTHKSVPGTKGHSYILPSNNTHTKPSKSHIYSRGNMPSNQKLPKENDKSFTNRKQGYNHSNSGVYSYGQDMQYATNQNGRWVQSAHVQLANQNGPNQSEMQVMNTHGMFDNQNMFEHPQYQRDSERFTHSTRLVQSSTEPQQQQQESNQMRQHQSYAIPEGYRRLQYSGLPEMTDGVPKRQPKGSTDSGIGDGVHSPYYAGDHNWAGSTKMDDIMDSQGILWEIPHQAITPRLEAYTPTDMVWQSPQQPDFYNGVIADSSSEYASSYDEDSGVSPTKVAQKLKHNPSMASTFKQTPLLDSRETDRLLKLQQKELRRQLKILKSQRKSLIQNPHTSTHYTGSGGTESDDMPDTSHVDKDSSSEESFSLRISPRRYRRALFCVFMYLDTKTLCHISQVSKTWYQISRHPSLWRRVTLRRSRISPKFLERISKWCTQIESLILEELKPRQRRKGEKKEVFFSTISGSLEKGLELLFGVNKKTLTSLRIVDCGYLITDRCIWMVSFHCRRLQRLAYISSTEPAGHNVLWSLSEGCRDIDTLILPPSYPCQSPYKFNNQCLYTIGKSWPHIRVLCIGGITVDVKGLVAIAKYCIRIQVLELDHMSEISDTTAASMCNVGLRGLNILEFTFTPVTPEALLQFNSACPLLKKIAVHVGISDYFEGSDSDDNIQKYQQIASKLKSLLVKPGFKEVLHIKTDYG